MRKQFAIGISICFAVIGITANPVRGSAQSPEDPLLNQRIELHLSKATLIYALSTLAVDHRVPIGIVYSAADENEPKLNLETDEGSLKEILDSIVKQEPIYRWELTDGVINFLPVAERDPFFEAFLNTPISVYDPGKWTIKFQLRDAIENTPEVQRLLKSRNVELGKYRDYATSQAYILRRTSI